MNDDNLALRFGWAQRYGAARCQGHLPSLPDTRKNFPASAEAIRNALGNVQRRVLTLPSPRKPSNNLFRHFRALGNLQTTCFVISEPSETFKQLVSSFPSPRKPSNNLFRHFRALGNLQTTCFVISEPSETFKQLVSSFPRPRGLCGGRHKSMLPPKKRFAFTFARPQEERHRSV